MFRRLHPLVKIYLVFMLGGLLLLGFLHCIGPVRQFFADQEVKKQTAGQLPEMSYDPGKAASSEKELFRQILDLAEWEEETRVSAAGIYGFGSYCHYDSFQYSAEPLGLGSKEDFIRYAQETQCKKALAELDQATRASIEQIFREQDPLFGVQKETVLDCYEEHDFDLIVKTVQAAAEGDPGTAFYWGHGQYLSLGIILPMDVAYALYPDVMAEACVRNINKAVQDNTREALVKAVECADTFSERYHVAYKNYEPVKAWLKTLNYAHDSGAPVVGMSLTDAKDTKLGPPSWEENNYTDHSGKLTWIRGSKYRTIFEAWYSDDTVIKINDLRSSSEKSSYSSGFGSSRKSSSVSGSDREPWEDPIDPDDYDLDGFYEDYEDEFEDDPDDAYDAFLDDEDLWDDY